MHASTCFTLVPFLIQNHLRHSRRYPLVRTLVRYEDFYGMLSDQVRMDAYERAIAARVRPGDIVVDLRSATATTCQNTVYAQFNRSGTVHGFAGWFDVALGDGIEISTAPGMPDTHWKQAFLPIREQVVVTNRDIIELSLSINAIGDKSDNTSISYDYRCSQLGNEPAETRNRQPAPENLGRNVPCFCGSGKKYKRCCLWKS